MVVVGDGEVALKGFCLTMYPFKVYRGRVDEFGCQVLSLRQQANWCWT